jgi:hypothetical protein
MRDAGVILANGTSAAYMKNEQGVIKLLSSTTALRFCPVREWHQGTTAELIGRICNFHGRRFVAAYTTEVECQKHARSANADLQQAFAKHLELICDLRLYAGCGGDRMSPQDGRPLLN